MTTTEALQEFKPHLNDIKDALAMNMLHDLALLPPLKQSTDENLQWVREEVRALEVEKITHNRTRMIKRIVTYLTPVTTAQAVGRITDEMIERAKAVPIEDLYDGRIVRGTGLCPFHNEATPSFHIWNDNRWHCFGACGIGGDSVAFYMKANGVDFKTAVRKLNNI